MAQVSQPHMVLVYLYPEVKLFDLNYLSCNNTKTSNVQMNLNVLMLPQSNLHLMATALCVRAYVCVKMSVLVSWEYIRKSFVIYILAEGPKGYRSRGSNTQGAQPLQLPVFFFFFIHSFKSSSLWGFPVSLASLIFRWIIRKCEGTAAGSEVKRNDRGVTLNSS